MRISVVTESFLPQVNGVSNSVRHVVEVLTRGGHQVQVIAPGPGPLEHHGVPVVRVRSVALPGYTTFPIGLPDRALEREMARFAPDVVHLASPIALGKVGQRAARRLGVPQVAVYQTDVVGFSKQYPFHADVPLSRWIGKIHRRAHRNLVPSAASAAQLADLGVSDVHRWGRGVRLDLFDPSRRDEALHAEWAPHGEALVGYVGRLAHEKQVHRLAELADVPGSRLVVVGDGPARPELERLLPGAVFTGMLGGTDLARAFATLDVFCHTGEAETFCQTVQEAQASGVAVVAPGVGGPVDLVEHGVSGMLHEPTRPASFRAHVAALVADPACRQQIAAAGRARVAGRTWDAVVGELVEHYDAVALRPAERVA
ncbi:GDP-mannose-dependent alpha-mannosyltransferase [Marmoricola endophyticus]|uniref:GDP-mannose-dependent alpha-mannosyltransferase n=1 Tax=Marmoricola endophyticus TaxID=2040280 RepID=A0A917EXF3_9ACTN|nr:glycosyltransferase family 1 protein [Marmoricola endophyticus]GGF30913.1 GDP-mannose-dependent alpha-mannosyltransferase [Marmoricola endophyticus]